MRGRRGAPFARLSSFRRYRNEHRAPIVIPSLPNMPVGNPVNESDRRLIHSLAPLHDGVMYAFRP